MASEPIVEIKEKVVDVADGKYDVPDRESALDIIHDGLVFPTEEEKQTLRRISDTIPWNAYRA